MYNLKIILIAIIFFLPLSSSFSHEGATGIIKERMEKFKESKSLMRQINKNLSNENFDAIRNASKKINEWAKIMPEYFPKGSEASIDNKSEASNNIWTDSENFLIAVTNFEVASAKLIAIASEKNQKKTVTAFRELAGTCKSCHQKFRN